MPDITMCSNRQCYMRTTCYRYCVVPSKYRQAYYCFDGYPKCAAYSEIFRHDRVQSSQEVDRQIDEWRKR